MSSLAFPLEPPLCNPCARNYDILCGSRVSTWSAHLYTRKTYQTKCRKWKTIRNKLCAKQEDSVEPSPLLCIQYKQLRRRARFHCVDWEAVTTNKQHTTIQRLILNTFAGNSNQAKGTAQVIHTSARHISDCKAQNDSSLSDCHSSQNEMIPKYKFSRHVVPSAWRTARIAELGFDNFPHPPRKALGRFP